MFVVLVVLFYCLGWVLLVVVCLGVFGFAVLGCFDGLLFWCWLRCLLLVVGCVVY